MSNETGPNREAAIHLHFPCFDGVVSAVLASEFLEGSLGWKISRYVPVNYDQAKNWRNTVVDGSFAVVDFLYHPAAFFWADHHATSFQDPNDRAALNRPSARRLYYDPNCPSCSLLLWTNLRTELRNSARLAEMVFWANKIDSATYDSVDEAIFGGSPAMDVSLSLAVERSDQYCNLLVSSLRTKSLDEVACFPEVRAAAQSVKGQLRRGLDEVGRHIGADGDIAICDIEQPEEGIISRYSPYYFKPDAKYSAMLVRSSNHAKVTAMRNPWLDFESVEIGKIFEKFGGGGHRRVGSVLLQGNRVDDASMVLAQIVNAIRESAKTENRASFA